MAISHCYWHVVVKNGNFTLFLTSSGPEWQFHIATDIKWSRMAISHCYWHLVVKNVNFTLLLTSSGQGMAIGRSTLISASRSTPEMHHGIYIMWCISQPFWILQEKVGISSYFWIIRVVNSQLALYIDVRCSPLSTPKHAQNTLKHPQMTIRDFNSNMWYLPWIPVHKTWQMNILWLMDLPVNWS